jgi:hypothetical protein
MDKKMSPNPVVVFEPRLYTDIILAALSCEVEVSGLAKISSDDACYRAYGSPVIYDQMCSHTETTFNTDSHHSWIQGMVKRGRGKELPEYRLWWHSHANSRVYLSGQDRFTIDYIFADNCDWLLAVVVNRRMDIYVELNIFRPVRLAPIPIMEFGFTEKFTREDFKEMLKQRKSRISKIVSSRVKLIPDSIPDEGLL